MPEQISIVPTWAAIMPTLLAVLQNPNAPQASKDAIEEELMRLARFADEVNQDG